MSTVEQHPTGGRSRPAPSRRVAVAAAQVLVAADRKLGRDTPEDVRRLAESRPRRTA